MSDQSRLLWTWSENLTVLAQDQLNRSMVKKDGQVDHYAMAILTTTVAKHGYPCCSRCFANHVQTAGGYLKDKSKVRGDFWHDFC